MAPQHVLLVSYPSQGNINPLLRLAKRLAAKGLLVTLSSTLGLARKIYASTNTVPGSLIAVGGRGGYLRFEFFTDGYDDDDNEVRLNDLDAYQTQLSTVGRGSFAKLVLRQAEEGNPVSCIVNSPFIPWALGVAEELNIPSAVLWVQSCSVYSAYYHYFNTLAEFPTDDCSDASVSIPGLPALRFDEVPSFIPGTHYKCMREVLRSQFANIHKAKWVFANSFAELERDAIDGVSMHSKIIPIGPLVDATDKLDMRGDLWEAVGDCIEWLNAQEPHSVVYMSLGSVATLDRAEMAEMAYGLKSSGRPSLWVVRPESEHLLPQGFAEDVKERGMVVGWSPQDEVLNHRAVACFVTHCGWNSTIELLNAGVPAIAYPLWGDQLTNAKFLVEVYKVGVRLKAPMEREEFVKCIEEVTDGGEKAEEMRNRCLCLKEAARSAVAEGGSSDRSILAFVDAIKKRD